jgi:TrmH family RNA methyltransferase
MAAAIEGTLARVRVVLSHPAGAGNIGAAARALKAMGVSRLALVNPRQFPDPRATDTAMGAADLLAVAQVCATLDEALAGTSLAIALSARQRDLSPLVLDAREAAHLAVAEAASGGEVAFVFGTEASGLSNDEVIRCQRVARIAASAQSPSLNLAAAVQVVAYEVRYAAVGAGRGRDAGPHTGGNLRGDGGTLRALGREPRHCRIPRSNEPPSVDGAVAAHPRPRAARVPGGERAARDAERVGCRATQRAPRRQALGAMTASRGLRLSR